MLGLEAKPRTDTGCHECQAQGCSARGMEHPEAGFFLFGVHGPLRGFRKACIMSQDGPLAWGSHGSGLGGRVLGGAGSRGITWGAHGQAGCWTRSVALPVHAFRVW